MKKIFIQLVLLIFVFSQITAQGFADSSPEPNKGKEKSEENKEMKTLDTGGGPTPEVLALMLIFSVTATTAYGVITSVIDDDREEYLFFHNENLKEEIATGEGEHLKTFAELFGCSPDVHQTFFDELQTNYDSLFPNEDHDRKEFVSQVETIIHGNADLNQGCSLQEKPE